MSRKRQSRPPSSDEEEDATPKRRKRDGLQAALHLRQQVEIEQPAAAAEEIEDPCQPVSRDKIDWTTWEQPEDDPILFPNWCLWSLYARTKSEMQKEGLKSAWQMLLTYHRDNHGQQDVFTFCRGMQDIYNTRIRDFLVNDQTGRAERGPAWPPWSIYNYTIKVRRSGNALICDWIYSIFHASEVMRDGQLFMQDSRTGRESVDLKVLDQYLKLVNTGYKLLTRYNEITANNNLNVPN